jgi:hypothetical protein
MFLDFFSIYVGVRVGLLVFHGRLSGNMDSLSRLELNVFFASFFVYASSQPLQNHPARLKLVSSDRTDRTTYSIILHNRLGSLTVFFLT